jgi:hypothetical protein
MDADLQDPPEVLPDMIKAMSEQQVEVVHTVRRRRHGEPAIKMFFTRIGYMILNRYSDTQLPIEAGDFKLLSRKAVTYILQMKEKPYMRGLVSWIGFKQAFVPYERQARFAGDSKFFIFGRKALSNFLNSLVNFTSVPLQIASYCGICSILIDFVLIFYVLSQKLAGVAVPGWTALMIVILFMGGVQLFSIGMIGLYLNSVHEQTKMRPLYIVESTYGINP